jgi:predicted HTH transcriptional regulator
VLTIIRSNPRVTAEEAAEQLGLKPRTIERTIRELKEKGLLERKGSKKSGFWKVRKHNEK